MAGRQGLIIALVLSIGINFFSYWFSDKIVLASYGAKPLGEAEAPRVHAVPGPALPSRASHGGGSGGMQLAVSS